jgi:uncharacterized glyoxalase superfamily protein PhnB
MSVRRVVPDVQCPPETMAVNRDFYGRLGLTEVMNMGWVMTMASPGNPTAQIIFMTSDATSPRDPDVSIELADPAAVDTAYAAMRAAGAEIVHPVQDEEWGVRRFMVTDPNGKVVNVLAHFDQ